MPIHGSQHSCLSRPTQRKQGYLGLVVREREVAAKPQPSSRATYATMAGGSALAKAGVLPKLIAACDKRERCFKGQLREDA